MKATRTKRGVNGFGNIEGVRASREKKDMET